MSQEDHAAGVADDYRDALEGLTMNSRVEISNLTLIARENTEAAHAISEVLQEHIIRVSAPRKLPALYLLDSIVKNVGTPYTLFFGRKLYSTFMEAYASVDQGTRRKMDEMLKTWKEPVPGSLDTRPVFPPDVVRPIENALIKARTSALQQQQEQMRGGRVRQGVPYRETPTPPGGARAVAGTPVGGGHPNGPGPNGRGALPGAPPAQLSYPMHPHPLQPPPAPSRTPVASPYAPPLAQHQRPDINPDALNSDVSQLIAATKAEIARNPYDTVVQTRLKALGDLQVILQMGGLPQDQLVLVKNQVDELSVKIRGVPAGSTLPHQQHPHPAHPHQQQPPPPLVLPSVATAPVAAPVAPPAPAPPGSISLDALLGKGALAALLARQSVTPQAGAAALVPPPPYPAAAAVPVATPPVGTALRSPPPPLPAGLGGSVAPAAPADPMSLIASLRKSGLLPPPPPGGSTNSPLPMLAPTPVSLSQGLPGVISPSGAAGSGLQGGGSTSASSALAMGDITLNSRSLKLPRLYLIATLHEDLGPACTQCGRRFRTDAAGRAAKTAHMDWHFRVHQRIAEAEKKSQHRSFYVDKQAWIQSREAVDDSDHANSSALAPNLSSAGGWDAGLGAGGGGGPAAGASSGSGPGAATGPRGRWIPVPDSGSTNSTCPICQEKFEMKWLEEAQEWVWMDAVRVGADRVLHASCHSEVAGGGRTPEPPPVLGKRKAEDDLASIRGKLKADPGRIKYDELPY